LYDDLKNVGIDTLLDDRDERPGSKFKDADLLGIPYRVTIGKRFTADGVVEVRRRWDGVTVELTPAEALDYIKTGVAEAANL